MNLVKMYDIETFPNYAVLTFVDVADYLSAIMPLYDKKGKLLVSELVKIKTIEAVPKRVFEISSVGGYIVDDTYALLEYVSDGDYLSGFNILGYDNLMLKCIGVEVMNNIKLDKLNRKLYDLSKLIVNSERYQLYEDWQYKVYNNFHMNFYSIDLQKIPALDKVHKSLKQTLINICWYKILEYKMPPISKLDRFFYNPNLDDRNLLLIEDWDRIVIKDYVSEIRVYNANDVYGCCDLFRVLIEKIQLRFDINEKFGLNTLCASDSKIADLFISKYYSEYTGIPYHEYKNLRTYRKSMKVGPMLNPNITFVTPECQGLLDKFKNMSVTTTKDIEISFKFNNITYKFGSGGLHSKDDARIFKEGAEGSVRDADVASYYPSLCINNKVAPAHLDGEAFLVITSVMKDERIEAKEAGDKTKADSLKITINVGMFGKFGFEYSFLYDLMCIFIITLNGQLSLIMLIERLYLVGIQNVSANTDGIVCIIPKDKEDIYYKTCKQWEKDVNLDLEYTDYITYARRDVNNYITVKRKKDGFLDIKRKGDLNQYLHTEDLKKGFSMPIVAKSVEEYLIHGVPISDTIKNERDIYLFCTTQNMDRKFVPMINSVSSTGESIMTAIQRQVRFYCSKDNTILFKVEDPKFTNVSKKSNLQVGTGVTIFNNYIHYEDFSNYNINYPFYIKLAEKLAYGIVTGKTKNTAKDKRARQDMFHTGGLFD